MNINDSAAIVTGGASGLGLASARQFVRSGVRVAIWDRNEEAGAQAAASIGAAFVPVDVGDSGSVAKAYALTRALLGIPRILVHCAGTAVAEKLVSRSAVHALDSFEETIRVNLMGTFYCCRICAADMRELDADEDGERGLMITTSSIAAVEGQMGQVAYAASKGAVASMTLPMARDLARDGIRSVCIMPGVFAGSTLATERRTDKMQKSLLEDAQFPKRSGRPEEFASLVTEICRNTMLNGVTLRLDGAVRLSPGPR